MKSIAEKINKQIESTESDEVKSRVSATFAFVVVLEHIYKKCPKCQGG